MESDDKILVPVTAEDLDMLEWFGAWTPEVYRAYWPVRRDWPPGFREVADVGVPGYRDEAKVRERMAFPPSRNGLKLTAGLIAYRLVEGAWGCVRLTIRGRAALKLAGRPCAERFESHAPGVFDDFVLGSDDEETEAYWRELLVEYQEDDYRGRHTLTHATAALHVTSSTGTNLNGSIRTHHRFVTFRFRNAAHQEILEANLSFEGLAELLTSSAETPATLGHYYGPDGMRRSEPAPPPVSARRRMLERLDAAEDRQAKVLRDLMDKVEGAVNIPKRLRAELLRDLGIALGNGRENQAFVVTQAVEEVSVAVESALAITVERFTMAGVGASAGSLPSSAALLAIAGIEDEATTTDVVAADQPVFETCATSEDEATRVAVEAIALTYDPPRPGGDVISRRAFYAAEVGRWRVRLAIDSVEEPEMIFNVVDADPGIEGTGLDLVRI